jgi:hypothetical protein
MSGMTIIEFIEARLVEDELVAAAISKGLSHGQRYEVYAPPPLDEIISWDPARVLREVEAKRRILGMEPGDTHGGYPDGYWEAVDQAQRHLASVYAGHTDYDEAWRP